VLKASGCGARVELTALPYADVLEDLDDVARWSCQLSGGDDYELLFTLSPEYETMLAIWQQKFDIDLTIIGKIVEGADIQCVTADGRDFEPENTGFEHFGQKS